MSNPKDVIVDAKGMSTHPNDLKLDNGALSVAENVIINRENVIERRRGFKDFSTSLPDVTPRQIFTSNGVTYAHCSSNLYRHNGSAWELVGLGGETAYGFDNIQRYNATSMFNGSSVYDNSTRQVTKLANTVTMSSGSTFWFDQVNAKLYYVNGHAIYQATVGGGAGSLLAGNVASSGTTNNTGSLARFNTPLGVVGDGAGSLYVTDSANESIRKVTYPGGVVTTFAGLSGSAGDTDATGGSARFTTPKGICLVGSNLYVTDANAKLKRITTPGAVVTTIATSWPHVFLSVSEDNLEIFASEAFVGIKRFLISNSTSSTIITIADSGPEHVINFGDRYFYAKKMAFRSTGLECTHAASFNASQIVTSDVLEVA